MSMKSRQLVRKWADLSVKTGPTDEKAGTELALQIYLLLGMHKPKITWVDNVWSGEVRQKIMRDRDNNIFDTTFKKLYLQLLTRALKMHPIDYIRLFDARPLGRLFWRPSYGGFHVGHFQEFLNIDMVRSTQPDYVQRSLDLMALVPWWRPFRDECFLSRRPTDILTDGENRLHNQHGPAISFRGKDFYFIHGVEIPERIIKSPHKITVKQINKQQNSEVRRIMIERYKLGQDPSGAAAYIKDAGAMIIDNDERYGILWMLPEMPFSADHRWAPTQPQMLLLEVINSTKEPDGTFKRYFLPMPPFAGITTAKAAVAWSFNQTAADYNPLVET